MEVPTNFNSNNEMALERNAKPKDRLKLTIKLTNPSQHKNNQADCPKRCYVQSDEHINDKQQQA